MKADDLLDAIGKIDDSYIEPIKREPKRRKIIWTGVGSLAACLFLVLFLPYGLLHRMALTESFDANYAPTDYVQFSVYYVNGDKLSHLTYEIDGGEEEMFFAWKNQNGIGSEVLLKSFVLEQISENISTQRPGPRYILHITVSSSFSAYLERDFKGLLLESLKETVASYAGAPIIDIELTLSE